MAVTRLCPSLNKVYHKRGVSAIGLRGRIATFGFLGKPDPRGYSFQFKANEAHKRAKNRVRRASIAAKGLDLLASGEDDESAALILAYSLYFPSLTANSYTIDAGGSYLVTANNWLGTGRDAVEFTQSDYTKVGQYRSPVMEPTQPWCAKIHLYAPPENPTAGAAFYPYFTLRRGNWIMRFSMRDVKLMRITSAWTQTAEDTLMGLYGIETPTDSDNDAILAAEETLYHTIGNVEVDGEVFGKSHNIVVIPEPRGVINVHMDGMRTWTRIEDPEILQGRADRVIWGDGPVTVRTKGTAAIWAIGKLQFNHEGQLRLGKYQTATSGTWQYSMLNGLPNSYTTASMANETIDAVWDEVCVNLETTDNAWTPFVYSGNALREPGVLSGNWGTVSFDSEDVVADRGDGGQNTSTTSSNIGIAGDSKTFTMNSSPVYVTGDSIRVTDSADRSANWMEGTVTGVVGFDVTFTVTKVAGSGSLSSWSVNRGGGCCIEEMTPTYAEKHRRLSVDISMLNIEGRITDNHINSGAVPEFHYPAFENRIADVYVGDYRIIKNGLIISSGHQGMKAVTDGLDADQVMKGDTRTMPLVTDGWGILDATTLEVLLPIGDGLRVGDYIRNCLKIAGYGTSDMTGVVAATGRVLPAARPGEDWRIQPSPGTSLGDWLREVIDLWALGPSGRGRQLWIDNNGVWNFAIRSTTPVCALVSTSGALQVFDGLSMLRDSSQAPNVFRCVGNGEMNGKQVEAEWIIYEGLDYQGGPQSRMYAGREIRHPTVRDDAFVSYGDCVWAARSLAGQYAKPGRFINSEIWYRADVFPGDRVTIDGVLVEVDQLSGGSIAFGSSYDTDFAGKLSLVGREINV